MAEDGTTEPAPWWHEAFPAATPAKSIPGHKQMLIVLAYDIRDPKRLVKVAKICEDYGARVQYSIFECHLEAGDFDELWLKLLCVIDEEEDRLVAYKLDARGAKEIETAGTMVCSEKVVLYLV